MEKNDRGDVLTITYEAFPTKENINYAFQKLVTPIIAATGYKPYQESQQDFKQILDTVTDWIILYANTNDLSKINWDEFINIRQRLFDLDSKYLPLDGCYAEEAYEWAIQLQVLLEKSNKGGNYKDGI